MRPTRPLPYRGLLAIALGILMAATLPAEETLPAAAPLTAAEPLPAAEPPPATEPTLATKPLAARFSGELSINPLEGGLERILLSGELPWLSALFSFDMAADEGPSFGGSIACPFAAVGNLKEAEAASRLDDPIDKDLFGLFATPETIFSPDTKALWSRAQGGPLPDVVLRTGPLGITMNGAYEAWGAWLGTEDSKRFSAGFTASCDPFLSESLIKADGCIVSTRTDEVSAESWIDSGRGRLLPGTLITRGGIGLLVDHPVFKSALRLDAALASLMTPGFILSGGAGLILRRFKFDAAYRSVLGDSGEGTEPLYLDENGRPAGRSSWAEAGILDELGLRASIRPLPRFLVSADLRRIGGRFAYMSALSPSLETRSPARTRYRIAIEYRLPLSRTEQIDMDMSMKTNFERTVTWLSSGSIDAEDRTKASARFVARSVRGQIALDIEGSCLSPESGPCALSERALLPGSLNPLDPSWKLKTGIELEYAFFTASLGLRFSFGDEAESPALVTKVEARLPDSKGAIQARCDEAGVITLGYAWERK